MKVCRLCLRTNVPICASVNTKALNLLENIFKLENRHMAMELHEMKSMCLICKALLLKTYKFIERVSAAQNIYNEILLEDEKVTYESLHNIDRFSLKLDVNLVQQQAFLIDLKDSNDINVYDDKVKQEQEENYDTEANLELQDPLCGDNKENITILTDSEDTSNIPCSEYTVENTDNFNKVDGNTKFANISINNEELNVENGTRSADTRSLGTDDGHDNSSDDCILANIRKSVKTKRIKHKRLTNLGSTNSKENINDKVNIDYMEEKKVIRKCKKVGKKAVLTRNRHNTISSSNPVLKRTQTDLSKSSPTKRRRLVTTYKESSEDSDENERKNYNQKDVDEDFRPREMEQDESSDSDYDMYDDDGKRMKKPDDRVYPMDCADCDQEIQSKTEHFHHYLVFHRDKEYPYKSNMKLVCHICGVVKSSKNHFKDHLLTHEANTKRYKCEICKKSFQTKKSLYKHMKRHLKPQLICDYCQKSFPVKSELKVHIRIHTGEKPFSCHICGVRYAHLGNVGVHIRAVHQNAPLKSKAKNTSEQETAAVKLNAKKKKQKPKTKTVKIKRSTTKKKQKPQASKGVKNTSKARKSIKTK